MKLNVILFKKNTIIEKAKQLGFKDVRICNISGGENHLILLVSVDRENKRAISTRDTLLSDVLMNELECIVEVIVDSKFKELYKNTKIPSISIDANSEEIEKIFAAKIDEVEFTNFEEKNSPLFLKRLDTASRVMQQMGTYNPAMFNAAASYETQEPKIKHIELTEEALRQEYATLPREVQKTRFNALAQSLGFKLNETSSPQGSPQHQPKYGIVK